MTGIWIWSSLTDFYVGSGGIVLVEGQGQQQLPQEDQSPSPPLDPMNFNASTSQAPSHIPPPMGPSATQIPQYWDDFDSRQTQWQQSFMSQFD